MAMAQAAAEARASMLDQTCVFYGSGSPWSHMFAHHEEVDEMLDLQVVFFVVNKKTHGGVIMPSVLAILLSFVPHCRRGEF